MTVRGEFSKAAIFAYATNWIFGIGVIEYPLGTFHPKISFVYATSLLSIYCMLAGYSYPYFLDLRIAQNYVSINIIFYSNIILTIAYVAFGWYRSKGMSVCVSKLLLADELLDKIGVQWNYAVMYKHCIIRTCVGLAFILSCITVDSVTILSKDMPLDKKILTSFVVSYPVIVMFAGDSLFVTIIRKVQFYSNTVHFRDFFVSTFAFFFYLNSHLSWKFNSLNGVLKTMLTSTGDFPQYKTIIKFRNCDLRSYAKKDDSSIIITSRKAHLELVEASLMANELYGLQMISSIAVTLVMITSELYTAFALIRYGVSPHKLHIALIVSTVWMFYYGIKMYVFGWSCTDCTQNANEAGDIITELYDELFISSETRQEIRNFIMQLLKVRVHYTAYGFIDLDSSLIYVMIGSITTYLMILIQFRNLADSANCGTT